MASVPATRMIALLRGVNVGGITVKSAPLATAFTEQGFTAVRTVLASGNVAFDAPDGTASAELAKLKHRIESALEQAFGYDAWIVLVPQERMARIAAAFLLNRSSDLSWTRGRNRRSSPRRTRSPARMRPSIRMSCSPPTKRSRRNCSPPPGI